MAEGESGGCAAALGAAFSPAGAEAPRARPGGISGAAGRRDGGGADAHRPLCGRPIPVVLEAVAEARGKRVVRAVVENDGAGRCSHATMPSSVRPVHTLRTTMPARRARCADITIASRARSARRALEPLDWSAASEMRLAAVEKATVRIAREPSTYQYLHERGISRRPVGRSGVSVSVCRMRGARQHRRAAVSSDLPALEQSDRACGCGSKAARCSKARG